MDARKLQADQVRANDWCVQRIRELRKKDIKMDGTELITDLASHILINHHAKPNQQAALEMACQYYYIDSLPVGHRMIINARSQHKLRRYHAFTARNNSKSK